MSARALLALGALNAAVAVGMGAFGAHALKARLAPDLLAVWHTGAQYHFYHALGLLLVGLLALQMPDSGLVRFSGWLMFAGVVLFSGSLYAIALGGMRVLGIVTPFGGLSFIAAWVVLAIAVLRES